MDLTQREEAFVSDDQSWLGSAHATDTGETVTLDITTFDLVTAFPNGFIPSGIVIAKVTSGGGTGKYGPYDPGGTPSNEVQSVIATGGSAGDFTLVYDGEETAAIAFDASAATVQAALLALSNIPPGGVVCAGGPLPNAAVTITFQGPLAGTNVPAITVGTENVTDGNAVVTQVTAGGTIGGAATDGRQDPATTRHLFHAVRAKTGDTSDKIGAAIWHGQVIEAKLPTGHGLDQAAKDGGLRLIDYV